MLLDAWRGIAAVWVVMIHSCLSFLYGHPEAIRHPVYAVSTWGQLGVVLFFVISGYCIFGAAYSCVSAGKSMGRYTLDRVRRIYPPYLAACVLILGVGVLTAFLQSRHILPPSSSLREPTRQDVVYWIANLTLTQLPAGVPSLLFVAWSLCYEIVFYVLVGAFLALSAVMGGTDLPRRAAFLAGAGILTTLVSLVWLCVSPATCPFPLDRWYQFGFGALLFAIVSQGGWRSPVTIKVSTLLCLLLGVGYACLSKSAPGELGQPSARIQALTCVLFFVTLLLLQPISERISRWKAIVPLMWLGTFSYSIYLVHMVFIPFADAGLRKFGFDGDRYFITYLVQLLVGIVSGWVFFLLVEKRFISVRQEKRIETELVPTTAVESGEPAGSPV